jgi:small subunit ribosomal protein S17
MAGKTKKETGNKDIQSEKKFSIRGNIFEGKVISAKAQKTITVQRELTHYISKYERYKKVFSKIKAHVPEGMKVEEGDIVRIGETRKISKTKTFILIKVIKIANPIQQAEIETEKEEKIPEKTKKEIKNEESKETKTKKKGEKK